MRVRRDQEEVAAHLARGQVDAVHIKAGRGHGGAGEQKLLHGLRGFKLGPYAGALACDANGAEDEEEENPDAEKERVESVEAKNVGPKMH